MCVWRKSCVKLTPQVLDITVIPILESGPSDVKLSGLIATSQNSLSLHFYKS